ncbi:TonB-dependent receptor [Salinivirga cyanobacteriivorans]|uniref:TonB-dependent receptor n=1 Tax=Salinivirga cyanobacteriivorans TaxID=1307839 RepID=A0A0S2I3E2_9BACT|nr:TonB-dependent receptor [Salinivirga cyanobacteriivorans]ALO16709.1 TonB-dependent receptor [Salinivirga cyanobacteriivorans]
MNLKSVVLFALLCFSSAMYAQNGTIRGTIIDDATGETLVGAQIIIKEMPGTGTITDLDGAFSLNVSPGNYTVQVRYISYQNMTIEDVNVESGEITVLGNLNLKEDNQVLQEVVVTAEAVKNSEIALMSMRKKSQVMMDGISASKMDLIGDATAVEAVKRVTGVSIEGGKYVYVRGLGDRYSKTTLNGVDIPGLDPDRNTLQMDIFPTNLVSNITVSKNFTADMPADFTGGLLNIETVAFPEKKVLNFSIGTGYNPKSNFNSDFLSYEGGSTDFLGFDDGTRSLPDDAKLNNMPTPISGASSSEVNSFLNSFSSGLDAETETSLMDLSLSVSFGNQIELKKQDSEPLNSPKLGYIFSVSYKNDFELYLNAEDGEYQRSTDNPSEYELLQADVKKGDIGKVNTLVGLLGGVAYKTNFSKIRMTLMHLQNGEKSAADLVIDNNDVAGQSGYEGLADILSYGQRSLSNLLIGGKHVYDNSGWEINWKVSPTYSISDDPDIRKTAFTIENKPLFNAGAAGFPTRIWRSLGEFNGVAKADLIKKHSLFGENAKLKFGFLYTYKHRNYEILKYTVQFFGSQPDWELADASLVLKPENLYPNGPIYYQSANNVPNPNQYSSNVHNRGLYLSEEFSFLSQFKSILGVRIENYVQRHTGRDQAGSTGASSGNVLDDEIVLNSTDFFPSAIIIYEISDNQKIRVSYSRTIARPSFKELSYAQIIDPVSDRIFNGGLHEYADWDGNLHETRINNYDLRWDYFMERGQIFSISAFYKQFDDPIELVRIPEGTTSPEYQPRNVGDGQLYGIEIEAVKSLGFVSPMLDNYNVSGNVTFVYSEIDMTDKEYYSRLGSARTGEKVKRTREMAGQSPYVVNAGFSYNNKDRGLDIGLFYNVKGPTLQVVGSRNIPDVYSKPFHGLNFSASKKLGKNENMSTDIKVSNILDQKRESIFMSYKATDQIYKSRYTGTSFSIGFSYKF